jgi:hypothetical protein
MAERSPDKHETVCKVCGVLQHRIRDGAFNGRTPKWRDLYGRLWNGRTCAECHAKQVVVRQYIKRQINRA